MRTGLPRVPDGVRAPPGKIFGPSCHSLSARPGRGRWTSPWRRAWGGTALALAAREY
ncbi:hypothetical protein [Streptomyces malaysiensis]|uniref:Uncharacterized protein n=1 Tax=Streptomyces malaysiensis subsp. samsunensis TaxID=459658 RepID=A0A9X2LXX2_STRMQ|nr:hypothetical protein [Streptomyces samsunensis]MCQ8832685.1 hypothetical protein [Streptomyces samsunensis]